MRKDKKDPKSDTDLRLPDTKYHSTGEIVSCILWSTLLVIILCLLLNKATAKWEKYYDYNSEDFRVTTETYIESPNK